MSFHASGVASPERLHGNKPRVERFVRHPGLESCGRMHPGGVRAYVGQQCIWRRGIAASLTVSLRSRNMPCRRGLMLFRPLRELIEPRSGGTAPSHFGKGMSAGFAPGGSGERAIFINIARNE